VLYLVHGLVHPDLAVSCCCSEMLARLASTHQQQPLQAIRCVLLVLQTLPCLEQRLHAVLQGVCVLLQVPFVPLTLQFMI
jgi:hypothetical protein